MINYCIEINSGDEYRAKIENIENKEEKEKIFFQDVYDKAENATNEIIKGMQEYSKNATQNGKYKAKYQGMGNNIIAFCAERGQGKTSAMQSFSNILKKKNQEKDSGLYFEVLDSIDPSSLDKGESIVRVLISRMFDNLTNILYIIQKYNYDYDYNEDNFQKTKIDIFDLFQECYENIDYLRKEKTIEKKSLERLAQLGSSARLKNNLYNLVEKYLQILNMYSINQNREKDVYKYLVVQIDDADLAVDNVFQICEDIRNYFSIPNVLVLMAANFTQLRNAINQCYLKQYKYIIKLQSKDFVHECSLMASRYIEKTFPVGHKIVLPDIDTIIKEEFGSIKIRYNCEPILFDENYYLCKDMQEQLLKALYHKTGIVLLKEEGKLHPFLPHTLRELTHFVKMLSEMKTVNHNIVFQLNSENSNEEEIKNLQANLSVIKEYFLEYWCHNHVKEYKYQRLMEKIGMENQELSLIYKYIKDCFNIKINMDAEKITCYDIFRELIENKQVNTSELKEALRLYCTIILNEWFVKVVGNRQEINNLIKVVGRIVNVSKLNNHGQIKGYNFFKFDFDYNDIMEYFGEKIESEETKRWFKDYCNNFVSTEEEMKKPIILENRQLIWNENCKNLHFDFFQALLVAIVQYWQLADREESELQNEQDSSEDDNLNETIDNEIISSRLVMAKNIIANYDVHRKIQEKINAICKDLEHEQNLKVFSDIYLDIYEVIDSVFSEDANYLYEQGNLQDIFKEHMGTNIRLQMLILSNEDNYRQYVTDYKKYLEKAINNKIKSLNGYRLNSNNYECLLNFRFSMFPGIIDFDIPNRRLKELKKLNNELCHNDEKLFNKIKELIEENKNKTSDTSTINNEDINEKIIEFVKQSIRFLESAKQELQNI